MGLTSRLLCREIGRSEFSSVWSRSDAESLVLSMLSARSGTGVHFECQFQPQPLLRSFDSWLIEAFFQCHSRKKVSTGTSVSTTCFYQKPRICPSCIRRITGYKSYPWLYSCFISTTAWQWQIGGGTGTSIIYLNVPVPNSSTYNASVPHNVGPKVQLLCPLHRQYFGAGNFICCSACFLASALMSILNFSQCS